MQKYCSDYGEGAPQACLRFFFQATSDHLSNNNIGSKLV